MIGRLDGLRLAISTMVLGGKGMGLAQSAPDALEYHERADEDLVSSAKAGDNLAMEFLLNKYKNFVRIKAKSYFLIGADREDIIQEGMIGLYKAECVRRDGRSAPSRTSSSSRRRGCTGSTPAGCTP